MKILDKNCINFDYKKPYYDFKAIRNNKYRLNIINGIMDDGKTFGAKEDMLERYLKYSESSIWIMNGMPLLSKEMSVFCISNIQFNKNWEKFEVKGDREGYIIGYYDKKPFVFFLNIGSATKTGRIEQTKNIYYDEFNYMDKRIYNVQSDKFKILLSRCMRINKIFLIGNATSLNIPLLYDLGIWEIKAEWTEFDVWDNFKGLFHNFKRDEKFIDNKYKDSIAYAIMKKSGYTKHAFENQYVLDNNANISRDYLKENPQHNLRYTFEISNNIKIDCYQVRDRHSQTLTMYLNLNENNLPVVYALNRDYVRDGVVYAPDISENIGMYFQQNRIYYQNITIKQKLYEIIKPFIFSL